MAVVTACYGLSSRERERERDVREGRTGDVLGIIFAKNALDGKLFSF